MRITDVIVHRLSTLLGEPFASSQGWITHRSSVIVEVTTDEGITGWGESLCQGLQPPEPAEAMILAKLRPMLLGREAEDVEVLWEEMYAATRQYGQGGIAVNAMSGVDIALWDALGRAVGKPVCKLLGGAFRSHVRPYATGFFRARSRVFPASGVEEARRHLASGFRGMKLKIGFGLENDLEFVFAVREAVGPAIYLMADANCAYSTGAARRLLHQAAGAQLHWLEEPLAPEDIEGYKTLRQVGPTYIAAGESLFGRFGFRHWITQGALDIAQPDLCAAGGFTECKKIAALAQAYSTPVIPHVWGSGIGLAASLQFIAALPPTPAAMAVDDMWVEYDQSDHPFRSDLINGKIKLEDGLVPIPMGPGLGVEVDREVIKAYEHP